MSDVLLNTPGFPFTPRQNAGGKARRHFFNARRGAVQTFTYERKHFYGLFKPELTRSPLHHGVIISQTVLGDASALPARYPSKHLCQPPDGIRSYSLAFQSRSIPRRCQLLVK